MSETAHEGIAVQLRYFAVTINDHWRIYDAQAKELLTRHHTRVTAQTGAYRLNAAIAKNRQDALGSASGEGDWA